MKIICNNAGKTDHCHVCSHGQPHEHRKWKACYMNVECPILKQKVHCVTVKQMKTTILLLLICGTLSAQPCKRELQFWTPAPAENYIAGAGLISTFVIVDLADKMHFEQYGTSVKRTQETHKVAAACMVSNVAIFFAVKETRKFIEKKKGRRNVRKW